MSDQMYTREQVRDILHSITYDDILDEEEFLELVRVIIKIYGQARLRKTPDCLIKAALLNALEVGSQKHYELGGT